MSSEYFNPAKVLKQLSNLGSKDHKKIFDEFGVV